jgi:hypothetical protein
MNAPELLRAGGWRQVPSVGGSVDWQHAERHGTTRFELGAAMLDELERVSRERDAERIDHAKTTEGLRICGEAFVAQHAIAARLGVELDGAAALLEVVDRGGTVDRSMVRAWLSRAPVQPARAPEPHWLLKDFHVLYASARALADACNGRGDGRPYLPLRALEAQLERLKPAFAETEATRAELAGHGEKRDG